MNVLYEILLDIDLMYTGNEILGNFEMYFMRVYPGAL